MAERKRSEGRLSTVPEGECGRIRSEVSGGPGMQSCMSRSLPNIHLDGSPAVSFAFSLSYLCM